MLSNHCNSIIIFPASFSRLFWNITCLDLEWWWPWHLSALYSFIASSSSWILFSFWSRRGYFASFPAGETEQVSEPSLSTNCSGDSIPPPGTPCHVLGWGFDVNFNPSRVLVDGTVLIKSALYCKHHFEDFYTEQLMCTVGVDDACYGDSGGPPLMWQLDTWQNGGHQQILWWVNVMLCYKTYNWWSCSLYPSAIPNELASTVCPTAEPPPSTTKPPPPLSSPTPSSSLSKYPIHQLYLIIIIPLFICILFTHYLLPQHY